MIYVNAQIFMRDGSDIVAANRIEPLPCEGTIVRGIEWLVPVTDRGRFSHYRAGVIQDVQPTPDSIKVIRLEITSKNQTVWIPIPNNGTLADWVNKCNMCCGNSPSMTLVTPPAVIIETTPCPSTPQGTPVYTFFDTFPQNPNALNISLSGSFNGAFPGVQPPAGGFANVAAVLTWVQANWAAYGTWTLENGNTRLQLESTTVTSAGFALGLVPKTYCLDIDANDGDVVDELVIGNQTISIPQTTIETANPQALYFAVQQYLPGVQLVFDSNNANAPYLQYTGLMVPVKFMLAGVDKAAWANGVCF
jgi:hypothetical protein